MATDLLNIAKTGASAARTALDITAQNIANASTEGYVRRSVQLAEVASTGSTTQVRDISLSGVRVAGIARDADGFRQAEMRRTGSDAARASAELGGLEDGLSAVENSGLYDSITGFEGSLQALAANPTDSSLRASVLESARTMTNSFQLAAHGLDSVSQGLQSEATDAVSQVNLYAGELARVNLQLTRTSNGSSDQTALLDRRDNLLQSLSKLTDISTTVSPTQTVEVRLGGSAGQVLVSGGTTGTLAMTTASDGTLAFTVNGAATTLAGGSLAGQSQALGELAKNRNDLDTLANNLISAANGAQTGGVALDGSPGQPMFSGGGASNIAVTLTSGAGIATAPAGAGANSLDPANLTAIQSALSGAGISNGADNLLLDMSNLVAGRRTTKSALDTIAQSAKLAFDQQAGVNLDDEAVNLVRYQQAFQASGRVMQVASTLFDTILSIK